MVTLTALWLPILLSGVGVFFLSALMWMMMPHHKKDFSRLPDEDSVMRILRAQNPAGQYSFPHCDGHAGMKDPAWQEKMKTGPAGLLYIMPPGGHNMGSAMLKSVVHNLLVAVLVAYVAAHALAPGAEYLAVFRIVGAVTILAYVGGRFADAIWMGHTWRSVWMQAVDGVVYGLFTAGIFGWLWPSAAASL